MYCAYICIHIGLVGWSITHTVNMNFENLATSRDSIWNFLFLHSIGLNNYFLTKLNVFNKMIYFSYLTKSKNKYWSINHTRNQFSEETENILLITISVYILQKQNNVKRSQSQSCHNSVIIAFNDVLTLKTDIIAIVSVYFRTV